MRTLSFNTPLIVSLASIALAGLVCVAQLPALAGTLFIGPPGEDPTLETLQEYLDGGVGERKDYTARFDGRSFFYKPKPPAPKPQAFIKETPVAKSIETPPVIKTTYNGPSVIYVFGDTVCFHGENMLLRVGEERNGVKVIATNPPWSVSVGWGGGQFEIDIFKRSTSGFEQETGAPGAPARAAIMPPIPGGGFVPQKSTGG